MALIYAQGGRLGSSGGGVVQASQFSTEGVQYTGNLPCFVWFRGDLYVVGYYTRPVVRHAGASGRWYLAGIRPPMQPLSVAVGVGSGGSSGTCLAATTFLHKAGLRVLAESNFSNVVSVGELGGAGRVWTGIDNQTAESRTTHVRGYVSMNGNDFRTAWEGPYGLTTITENVRTGQLTFLGPQAYDHVIPPATRFGHIAFGRMWYANSAKFPYRLWYSKAGEPQYTSLAGFRDTTDREPITAIWKGRNELLVWGIRSAYMVRQFGNGQDDFVLEKLDSDVGCLTHFGISEIHNRVWFPSEDGIWIYDGGFKHLMKELVPLWKADYEQDKDPFLNGFAMHDRINKCYIFVTQRQSRPEFEDTGMLAGSVEYVGYYGSFDPSLAGDQQHPDWMIDLKDRFDSCGFYNGDGELVIGSCDGKLRKQDFDEGEDDGDLLRKGAIIRTGHQLFFEPGDELEYGKRLVQLWAYVESESNAWTIYCRGGDEQTWKAMLPDANFWYWNTVVPASELEETRVIRGRDQSQRTYDIRYVPATVHTFTPEKVTGRGFTFELRATAPIRMEYRGIGGAWEPGPIQRSMDEVTNYDLILGIGTTPASTLVAIDPRNTNVVPVIVGAVTVNFTVRVNAYTFGTPAFPIVVTFTATGVGAWTQTVNVVALATSVGVSQAIAIGDEWEISVSAVDANGVPANPVYAFDVTRPA